MWILVLGSYCAHEKTRSQGQGEHLVRSCEHLVRSCLGKVHANNCSGLPLGSLSKERGLRDPIGMMGLWTEYEKLAFT